MGILAAAYFFIVKPVLDTTETISSETNESIQKSFENSGFNEIDVTLENVNKRVEKQLNQALKQSKQHGDLDKLRICMKKAVGDVDRGQALRQQVRLKTSPEPLCGVLGRLNSAAIQALCVLA